jgi:hypothetical protein
MDSPLDDTDLPDHDYESIYGREAMHARLLAKLDAILKRMETRPSAWRADTTARRPPQPQDG